MGEPVFSTDWFSTRIPTLTKVLEEYKNKPDLRFLEIGTWQGQSACWFLQNILTHESSTLTCVDTWAGSPSIEMLHPQLIAGSEAAFDANMQAIGATAKVRKLKGRSSQMLRTLDLATFDFIYVDGGHEATETLNDAVLAWQLLKPGGIIVFDDYDWKYFRHPLRRPKPAIDSFLHVFGREAELLTSGWQIALRKRQPMPAAKDLPFVSVIVPVFNDPERLLLCLDCLQHQTYPRDRYEVIVIDNASEPPVSVPQTGNVRLIHEADPGAYPARNTAIATAKGEILAFTDADCLPEQDWLEEGIRMLLENPALGIVGGEVEMFHRTQPPTQLQQFDFRTRLNQRHYVELGFACTANAFVRRPAGDKAGWFDVRLHALADWVLTDAIRKAGYGLAFAEHAVVRHPTEERFGAFVQRNRRDGGGVHDLKRFGLPRGVYPTLWQEVGMLLRLPFSCMANSGLGSVWERMRFLAWSCLQETIKIAERLRLRIGGEAVR